MGAPYKRTCWGDEMKKTSLFLAVTVLSGMALSPGAAAGSLRHRGELDGNVLNRYGRALRAPPDLPLG